MIGSPYALRPATIEDAGGCARVHHASWKETYSGLLPETHWESDALESRIASWQEWLEAGAEVTVAEAAGEIVGIALGGPGRTVGDHAPVRDHELYMLYVLRAHHGTGIGQALLDATLPPGTPAQLWVAEQNPRARRFYERNGFIADGARHLDEALGLAEVRHVR